MDYKPLDFRRKNRRKAVRTIVQLAVVALLFFLLVNALLSINSYREPDRSEWKNREGFVAISYFGVGRKGTNELMAKERLGEQLRALYERGYETVSQSDILAFYKEGKPLPEKALFLAFEDGRNDSELFSSGFLERYNFKATLLSYADKAGNKEGKFIQPKEMLKMMKTGYWELGSNGYRLEYINIVDKDGQFMGMRKHNEFLNQIGADYYTHYLMDFLRDEYGIPVETREEMEGRLNSDYDLLERVYNTKLGFVPGVYMIMHANTMYSDMNPLVEAVNETNIRKLFQMHFNREGASYNSASGNVYNLTRVQPAPYWQTNHLLMQLKRDSNGELPFVVGDSAAASHWKLGDGAAAEFKEDWIALTTPPGKEGTLTLQNSQKWGDVEIKLNFGGHYSGYQSLYLRSDDDRESYIRILLREGELVVDQKAKEETVERLLAYPIDNGRGTARKETSLKVKLIGDKLDLWMDGNKLLDQESVKPSINSGSLLLSAEADSKEVRWNEYDERDTIYDGVFRALEVRTATIRDEKGEVLFTSRGSLWNSISNGIERAFHGAIDWAIDTF